MKKRLLFVDDEPSVLQLYRAMFASLREEWEMEFVESAERALECFARSPYDVVVSDLRMPGMTGAQLLNEIMQRYPRTARIILSGYADQEAVAQCVGATHQYLAKPCGIGALRATLHRVTELNRWLPTEPLRGLVAGLRHLPSLPALYFRILDELMSPRASAESIAAIVAQDLAMTAKLLQLVNSSFFGSRREVYDAAEAVQIVGVEAIRDLVLAVHLFACCKRADQNPAWRDRLWRHSWATANEARRLVEREGGHEFMQEAAFTAGLLHDAGKLILAANLPDLYREAVSVAQTREMPLWRAEREAIGATDAEVGAYLFGLWGLPAVIVEAVAWHYQPSQSPASNTFSALTAVHLANVLEEADQPETAEGAPSLPDLTHLEAVGLGDRVPGRSNATCCSTSLRA